MGVWDWAKGNQSNIMGGGSAALDFFSQYNNSKVEKAQGKLNAVLGELEADSLRRKATMSENQGVHAAEAEKYKGRVAHSDATAAMASGGGTVDPEMLARIKQRADYNAMSAVYDARTVASGLRQQASMASIKGRFDSAMSGVKADDMMAGAVTTALTDWPKSWSQSPKPPGAGAKSTYGVGTMRKSNNKSLGGKGYVGGF